MALVASLARDRGRPNEGMVFFVRREVAPPFASNTKVLDASGITVKTDSLQPSTGACGVRASQSLSSKTHLHFLSLIALTSSPKQLDAHQKTLAINLDDTSDDLYGGASRYVSIQRLEEMLGGERELLYFLASKFIVLVRPTS
jgi:hypothetical protein